jgi:cytochrome c-type biogenesis protein CcmH/NrfF
MAAPIQSPAKCEVRSVVRFLNAKGERPAEIHKQIVAVYGNFMISTCFFT